MKSPEVILLFSGKRKSGKDYICEKIQSILGTEKSTIVRISGPLKHLYAQTHNLDFDELLSDSPYKENYRLDMINWSDNIRANEPGYFCKAACEQAEEKKVWIVSDVRRKTDVSWFKETFADKIKTIRIEADLHVRKKRHWRFTEGVDDAVSECNLDDYTEWDLKINNNNEDELEKALEEIQALLNSLL